MTDQGWGYNTTADPPVRPPKGKDPNSTAPVPVRTATELYPGRVIVVCTRTSQVTSCVVSCVLRFSAFGVRVVHVPSDVERRGGGEGVVVLLALSPREGWLEICMFLLTSMIPREGTPTHLSRRHIVRFMNTENQVHVQAQLQATVYLENHRTGARSIEIDMDEGEPRSP